MAAGSCSMPPLLTPRRVTLALAIALAAVLLSFRGVYEPDLWWHLAHGREDARGDLVRANLFSFLYPEYRQHFTSWLYETTAFAAWTLVGGLGIQTLHALLLAAAFTLVYRACRIRGPASAAAAVLFVGFFVIEPRAIPRPHVVSLVGLAACALIVERAMLQRSARPLILLVPITALWANFHVEVVFGVAFLSMAALAELMRPSALPRAEAWRAVAIAIACGLATLATPYGWGIAAYFYENTGLPRMLNIAEIRPPYLPEYRAFFTYVLAAGVLLVAQPRRFQLREAAVFVVFAALGLRYLRLTPLVFFATAPMLTSRLALQLQRGLDPRALLLTALIVGLAASRVPPRILATSLRIGDEAVRPPAFFSEAAIAFARAEGLEGPVFNSFNLGGYLAWALYPHVQIFQDTRLQAYPPGHFQTIINASRSQADWDTLMSGVDWAVLSLARPGELSGTGRFPRQEWATVFWDEAIAIVVRRTGRFSDVASRREYREVVYGADPFVVAGRVVTGDAARVRTEALRNAAENPRGFLGPAVLCLTGDQTGCATLDRLAAERPELRERIAPLRRSQER